MTKFEKMSEEELRELSLRKTKKGVATKSALKAQVELWERKNFGKHHSHEYAEDVLDPYYLS